MRFHAKRQPSLRAERSNPAIVTSAGLPRLPGSKPFRLTFLRKESQLDGEVFANPKRSFSNDASSGKRHDRWIASLRSQ
jgi:hypothetical protein